MFTKKNFCICIVLILILLLSGTALAVKKDIAMFTRLAKKGNLTAQEALAKYYYYGSAADPYVEQDYEQAAFWSIKAAAQGSRAAKIYLSNMYFEGKGVKQDYKKAFDMYTELGSEYKLGMMYENGYGVQTDIQKAIEYYNKVAREHLSGRLNPDGEKAIAALKRLGIDTTSQINLQTYKSKSYKDINSLYQAAQNGNASDQYQLADAYFRGNGIQQDYQQAGYWYQKAAEQNLVEAQYTLGMMYYQGAGTEKDYVQAEYWFTRAADNGDVNARNHLQAVAPQAEAQRRAEAQKAALAQKQAEEEARKRALVQKQAEQKRAKTAQKSSQPARQKQVQVWQCVKCGARWGELQNQAWQAFGLGAIYDALNGGNDGLPPNIIDCEMGGYCVWQRIK